MSKRSLTTAAILLSVAGVTYFAASQGLLSGAGLRGLFAQEGTTKPLPETFAPGKGEKIATFAGGCFWCMEPPFEELRGVRQVVSGFAGGEEKNPSYKDVSYGRTGHTEAVRIVFDPKQIRYEDLLAVYWRSFDPTDAGGQFADRGKQYRPVIFVHDKKQRAAAEASKKALVASKRFKTPIIVPIEDYTSFWPAETYHQDYYKKNYTHYKAYRRGSGREAFLTKAWKGAAPLKLAKKTRYKRPSDAEIKKRLTPLQYRVTQKDDTEPPFDNKYWNNKAAGIYVDIVTGEPLFSSKHKYKSGSGWPSFYKPLAPGNVIEKRDSSYGRVRIELRSKHGNSHLGHIFDDGPAPTGLRYCINSASLRFIPAKDLKREGYATYAQSFQAPTTRPTKR